MDRMRMLAAGVGRVWVTPASAVEASDIGSYWNAVRRYTRTGDTSELWPFEGVFIGDFEFETDPDEIDVLALEGELEFEDIYERD
jgi:hypothetical protein